jgi:hypothetical protein
VAVEIPALASVIALAAILALLIAYEVRRYGEARDRLRHQLRHE